uniref:Uncharacterized protein n=1 Tax=Caenorhabditis japonica TaxID=281687 RepID=A0A8R1DM56_CAEJA
MLLLLRHLDNSHRRKKNTVADCLSRAREDDEPAEYTELKDISRVSGVHEGSTEHSPKKNRTLVVKRNQPTSVLNITEEQAEKILAFDSDTLNDDEAMDTDTFENGPAVDQEVVEMIHAGCGAVHSNHTPVLRKPADYDEYTNKKNTEEAEAVDLKVEEVEVEEIKAEEKSQGRGEVETHPPPAQVDVTDLPAKAISTHSLALIVEPIEKMDPPDSATKRMAFYCTLDMIQAGRNKSITDARAINEARPTLKRIRRENPQTIDFWQNTLTEHCRMYSGTATEGDDPCQFLKSVLEDDYATILQRTNDHLTSDPTPPSVVTIKHLSRRDAEYFDTMPQPFQRFNGDKGRALAALVEYAFMGFTGIMAAANKNRDVRAYATTVTNCT